MSVPTKAHLRANGHAFRPIRWQRGSSSPGCECGHDFGHVGGKMDQCVAHHDRHLETLQTEPEDCTASPKCFGCDGRPGCTYPGRPR